MVPAVGRAVEGDPDSPAASRSPAAAAVLRVTGLAQPPPLHDAAAVGVPSPRVAPRLARLPDATGPAEGRDAVLAAEGAPSLAEIVARAARSASVEALPIYRAARASGSGG